jgi:DNA-binding CsgD family transcriptional regulator
MLSVKSEKILRMIAEGHSYEQIMKAEPGVTYLDIFGAAKEALEFAGQSVEAGEDMGEAEKKSIAKVREKHPRAYMPWTREEEKRLVALYRDGLMPKEISERLERQPSAIRSRIERLVSSEDTGPPTEPRDSESRL